MNRIASSFILAATLCAASSLALAADEAVTLPSWEPGVCGPAVYPKRALEEDEEGVIAVAVLVDAAGAPVETRVLLSSGSRELDRAAQQGYLKCRYTPGKVGSQPAAMWRFITYVWRIEPNNGKLVESLAQAALAGSAAARYKLSVVLDMRASGEAEWREAMELLVGAAEQGEPMAQIALGQMYELGQLAAGKNMDEARRWYALAAAQGNVYAIDHLRFIGPPR